MARCSVCGQESPVVNAALSVCCACLRERWGEAESLVRAAHSESRRAFRLPEVPPRDRGGLACALCANECVMGPGRTGFCGVRRNENGRLVGANAERANVSWYHDPLPTNCVASWVCPAETAAGYPTYTHTAGPEYGCYNLAVFYQACSFDCLFCQNWHFRRAAGHPDWATAQQLADSAHSRTTCICYFGGDPGPQAPHAIRASRLALKQNKGRVLRICWETNGCENPAILDEMLDLSLESGGCVKFDLKAWDERVHIALTGVSNARTLDNFRRAASRMGERPDPPLVVASTLLVPGYVEPEEVAGIARFIADINPDIPYSLLGFHPQFYMHDLPCTSRDHAEECLEAARGAGLRRVRIGNVHVLGPAY